MAGVAYPASLQADPAFPCPDLRPSRLEPLTRERGTARAVAARALGGGVDEIRS